MTLQSYILSTTTETFPAGKAEASIRASIVHPFNNTETQIAALYALAAIGFNRTSFQQQLKLLGKLVNVFVTVGFNRTSFQQQLKLIPKKGKIPPLTKLSLILTDSQSQENSFLFNCIFFQQKSSNAATKHSNSFDRTFLNELVFVDPLK